MKKLLYFICSLYLLSCSEPNFKTVKSEILKNELNAKDLALSKVYQLYSESDKSKTNYEVYNINMRFGLNYNPSKKLLFLATDLCEWIRVYKNVDDTKIQLAIKQNIKVDGYDNFFEIDQSTYSSNKEGLNTNSCNGGKTPF